MGKIVQNSISYSGVSARNYVDIVDTLYAGETSVTIRSASLNVDSTVTIFTDRYGWNPTSVSIGNNYITLNLPAMSENHNVKVRIWDESAGGQIYDDGNNIYYPVGSPSQGNKLYKEADVSNIAYALGRNLKISEMAGAVQTIVEQGGVIPYQGTLAVVMADSQIDQYSPLTSIKDTFIGDGSTTRFTLSNRVAFRGLVTVGGSATSGYSIDNTSQEIIFTTAPTSGSSIVVNYWIYSN